MAFYKHKTDKDIKKKYKMRKALFTDSPVALLRQDISQVKTHFLQLIQKNKIDNLEKYLENHSGDIVKAINSVKIKEVNNAALNFFEYESLEDIAANFHKVFIPEFMSLYARNFGEIIKKNYTEIALPFRTSAGEIKWGLGNIALIKGHKEEHDEALLAITNVTERKKVEEEISENLKKFNVIFSDNPVGLLTLDKNGFINAVNPAIAEIMDLSIDTLTEKIKINSLPIFRNAGIDHYFEDLVKRNKQFDFESQLLTTKTGKQIYLRCRSRVIRDDKENPVSYIILLGDITTRKKKELELKKSKKEYKTIFNQFIDLYYQTDMKGIITKLSPSVKSLAGYEPEELIGHSVYDLYYHPNDRKFFLKKLIKSGIVRNYQLKLIDKFGDVRCVSLNSHVIFDENKKPLGTEGVMRDVSKQTEAEEKLKKSEKRFSDLVAASSDWIWETDSNGVYTYVSENVKDVLGYESCEIIGKTPLDFMSAEERDKIPSKFQNIVAQKNTIKDMENWNIAKNGNRVCFSTNGVPIFDDYHKFIGYRGLDKDITERKQVEVDFAKVQNDHS